MGIVEEIQQINQNKDLNHLYQTCHLYDDEHLTIKLTTSNGTIQEPEVYTTDIAIIYKWQMQNGELVVIKENK